MNTSIETTREWLETDGLGGFASGTATGIRTRRYHGLLLTATTPPTGRMTLVNGFDAWVKTGEGEFMLSSQRYAPDVIGGDGADRIEAFAWHPWPHWIFKVTDDVRIEFELFAVKGRPMTCLRWKLLGAQRDVTLCVRPFLSGRDYHSLHKRNDSFRFEADVKVDRVSWTPYNGVPGITAITNGTYAHEPHWYNNFCYAEEQARGLDYTEDLAAPGIISWNLATGPASLVFSTEEHAAAELPAIVKPVELFNRFRSDECNRRKSFASPLHKSADDYIVRRGDGKTIIAGYPWFTDWGGDTFIALRGLCLTGQSRAREQAVYLSDAGSTKPLAHARGSVGRLREAGDILLAWAATVSEGMLPNRFPDGGVQPEYNSVDASLWYIIAVHDYLHVAKPNRAETKTLFNAVESILDGYSRGTRFGIRADEDGLLACGAPGVQLTWMDAKVGDWVVTPRVGKPVEIQALWLNALKIAAAFSPRWDATFERGKGSFQQRFWNENLGCLYDVIDCDHQRGTVDCVFRPNQIFAVGGLPFCLLDEDRAEKIVSTIERKLWAPLGLRSLAPNENAYCAHYDGTLRERDGAYHQGTVWPWLIGPFVEAWIRVRGASAETKCEAQKKFLAPLLRHIEEAGLGHISEIADGDQSHTPRGCPFQAWSVGELLRAQQLLAPTPPRNRVKQTCSAKPMPAFA